MNEISNRSVTSLYISVIVTFYNLENCVEYCLDSLFSQSYTNSEFLLIDDGSTDGTAEKLDTYASDPRVRVIHKSNGGLSSARNCGVANAKGEYVTFIDGDDIVSPYYLEHLAAGVRSSKKTLVTGDYKVISRISSDFRWDRGQESRVNYIEKTKEQALNELLYEEIKASAPAKLAPREIYLEHPFPVGFYYEEISTAAHYISMVDCVVKFEGADYGYVMRPGSITHNKTATIKQAQDMILAIGLLESKSIEVIGNVPSVNYHESLQMSRLYWLLRSVPDCKEKVLMCREVHRRISESYGGMLKDDRVGLAAKLRFTLLRFAPPLYSILFSVYEKTKMA